MKVRIFRVTMLVLILVLAAVVPASAAPRPKLSVGEFTYTPVSAPVDNVYYCPNDNCGTFQATNINWTDKKGVAVFFDLKIAYPNEGFTTIAYQSPATGRYPQNLTLSGAFAWSTAGFTPGACIWVTPWVRLLDKITNTIRSVYGSTTYKLCYMDPPA